MSEDGSASTCPDPGDLAGGISPFSLGKWKLWSSSKPLVSVEMKDQRHRPNKGLPGMQGKWSAPPLCCPLHLHLPGLTFFTGGLVGGVRAVRSAITLQEAVDAAAIAAVKLGGVTGARAHWIGQDGVGGEVRLQQGPESIKGPPSTWPSLPQHIIKCPLSPFQTPQPPQPVNFLIYKQGGSS